MADPFPIKNVDDLAKALGKLSKEQRKAAGLDEVSVVDAKDTAELEKQLALKREELLLQKQLADAVQDGTKARVAQKELMFEELKALQQSYKLKLDEGALNEETEAQLQQRLDIIKQTYGIEALTLEGLPDKVAKTGKELKEATKFSDKYESSINSLGQHMVIAGKGPLVQFALKTRELGKELETSAEAQIQFREAIVDAFNFTNLFGNLLNVVAESTMALVLGLDAASTSLAAATGFGNQFNQTMRDAQQQGNYLGVTMDGAGKAIQGLSTNFTNFVNISEESRSSLVANVAQLERIGVSADTSAGLINFFNQNLGMTAEEGVRVTKELAMMGRELGMTSAQITKDFQAALPTLAVYGDRSQEVFKGLASAAKVAGVEMNKLLSLAGKFDTFASAAETTGKLNAILGTQMSAVDLMRQSEERRIETLISSMQAQGRSFKDMDRFTQKAIAAAAGIDDLAEAQRIFGMDIGQYKEYQNEMSKSAAVQKKFEEAVQKTIPIQEKLKLIAAEFAVAVVPILESVTNFLDGALKLYSSFDPGTKDIINSTIVAVGALVMSIKTFGAVIAIGKTLFQPLAFMGKVLGLFSSTTINAAEEMAEASEHVPETMENISEGIGVGIERIADAAAHNAKGLGILVLSLIGIAGAVALMGYAIKGTDFGAFAGLTLLIGGLLVVALLAGKIAATGAGALIVAAGFALIAGGIAMIGGALHAFPVDVLSQVSSIMSSLVNLSMDNVAAVGAAFTALATGLQTVSDTANELDGKKVKISSVIENLALLSVGTAKDSMTGAKISTSAVNVVNNLKNAINFDGMEVKVSIGEQEFRSAVVTAVQKN